MNPITYNFTGIIENYTVPVTGTYNLSGVGAGGGSSEVSLGGRGASVGATFDLTAGQQLQIVVGGVGNGSGSGGSGGGGFTQILVNSGANGSYVPLLIAGGGGGGGSNSGSNGTSATLVDSTPSGGGGGGLSTNPTATGGGGGGGATSNGTPGDGSFETVNGNPVFYSGGGGGRSVANGAAGGTGNGTGIEGAGGYGGGGGSGQGLGGGGGGGGSTGGNGGSSGSGGGGGTSYLAASGTQRIVGASTNTGDGSARIALVQPPNNVPCYCTGTRILTDRGSVAVEDLAIGDTVVTASGARRPIRWIGTRSYGGRFANANPAVLPVTVRAGALADGVPARDLAVSPDHALFLDGLLVPAELLVNGASVTRAERIESVTYWHVELDSHDVLLAEGAPAESYVDDGGRAIFHNAASSRAPCPGAAPAAAVYCAPRVADNGAHGYALEAIRRRLAIRAGLPVARARVFGALRGAVEACDGRRVTGWAQDAAHPDGPVCLDVVVDGATVALVYADAYRADLEAAGIGDGCHGFALDLPEALDGRAPHTVELRRSADATSLGILHLPALARSDRAA